MKRRAMSDSILCPSCKTGLMEIFFQANSVPTNDCILLATPEEAVSYPRGDISLGFCTSCGFISNTSFNPKLTEYSGRYEETQGFSETFNAFHHALAERLIERHDLRGKDVLEIGCGKGEFLTLISELGNNRGIGFDPGYHEERNPGSAENQVTFIKDFYSEKYAHHKADFICCKMTLEHIHNTSDFVGMVRKAIGDNADTLVFFQIPDATRIIRDAAFEDIYYEHCSYFTPGSLGRLFRSQGFRVLSLETEYDDQYLMIEAKPEVGAAAEPLPQEDDLEDMRHLVADFPNKCREKLDAWNQCLLSYAKDGKKIILWGSGSKAVSFLNTLSAGTQVEYVVDINPYRHGYYMPGTGQEIVAPEFLRNYHPDVVIVMNAIYRDEIQRDLNNMGLNPEIKAL